MKLFKIAQLNINDIKSVVDDSSTIAEVKNKLIEMKFPFEEKSFDGDFILLATINNKKYVIDDFPSMEEATEWIWTLRDSELNRYSGAVDFNNWFWKESGISELYHGTHKENVDSIKINGLTRRNQSRGISNRSTGNAIFTTTEESFTDSYGDIVVVIDVSAMRNDNFLIHVEKESPIQIAEQRDRLACKLGIEEFCAYDGMDSDGMWDTTVVIFNDIPPKYLRFEGKTR